MILVISSDTHPCKWLQHEARWQMTFCSFLSIFNLSGIWVNWKSVWGIDMPERPLDEVQVHIFLWCCNYPLVAAVHKNKTEWDEIWNKTELQEVSSQLATNQLSLTMWKIMRWIVQHVVAWHWARRINEMGQKATHFLWRRRRWICWGWLPAQLHKWPPSWHCYLPSCHNLEEVFFTTIFWWVKCKGLKPYWLH